MKSPLIMSHKPLYIQSLLCCVAMVFIYGSFLRRWRNDEKQGDLKFQESVGSLAHCILDLVAHLSLQREGKARKDRSRILLSLNFRSYQMV